MVLAPEKPPQTDQGDRQVKRLLLALGIIVVVALAVFGLVSLLSDGTEPAVGPGPEGPGPQGPVGPQGQIDPGGDGAVIGSGTIASEARDVPGFTGVVIAAEGSVVLVQSDQQSVTLQTDDNLLELVTTEVRDSTLYIDTVAGVDDIDPTDGVRFAINAPDITRIAITGSGSIAIDGLVADEVAIEMAGAGTIEVSGLEATFLDVTGIGAGLMEVAGVVGSQEIAMDGTVGYQAGDLMSASAVVDTNTVSDVVVWVTDELAVVQRGIGTFSYYGTPQIESEMIGAGPVRPLGAK